MLSLALRARPSPQLHQAFPGTAVAADTSEDRFSVRSQAVDPVPGARLLITERPPHTRSSSQQSRARLPLPARLTGLFLSVLSCL